MHQPRHGRGGVLDLDDTVISHLSRMAQRVAAARWLRRQVLDQQIARRRMWLVALGGRDVRLIGTAAMAFDFSTARAPPLALCRRHLRGCVRFGPGVGRCKPRFTESEAPPVQPSPCRCAPAPLPSSGPSASAYSRPQGTAPEGLDAGTAPAAPPRAEEKGSRS